MRVYKLTLLLIIVTGCKFKTTGEIVEGRTAPTERPVIELNPKLIKDFYKGSENENYDFTETAEFKTDLDQNGKADIIALSKLKRIGDDPGDFHKIVITLDNGFTWTEQNFDGWVRFDNNYSVPDPIKKINEIDTDLLLLTEFGNSKMIGLFGWVYANEPGLLTIIEFSSGTPRVMINQQLDLVSLDSLRITTKFLDDKCWTEIRNNKLIMTCE